VAQKLRDEHNKQLDLLIGLWSEEDIKFGEDED
jgi:hypothetical protein